MTKEHEEKLNTYNQRNIDTMELVYGDGFMSPGGPAEVRKIAQGLDLRNSEILDLGCGLGGACIALAQMSPSLTVKGVDIEPSVLERARTLVAAAQLKERVELLKIAPGRLPFDDNRFDYVYANSVTCHFEHLGVLFHDVLRVLKPGGQFFGSEWFIDSNDAAFQRWDTLLRERGLNFYFVRRKIFESALLDANFTTARFCDRRESITAVAVHALERVEGELHGQLTSNLGHEGYSGLLSWTRNRAAVLQEQGMTHCHFYAAKP